jgi:hypothetical protein
VLTGVDECEAHGDWVEDEERSGEAWNEAPEEERYEQGFCGVE